MRITIKLMLAIIILASFSFGISSTGDIDIKWGNEFKESKRSTLSKVAGTDESGFYAIRTKSKGLLGFNTDFSIEHYNRDMNLSKSVELDLKYEDKDREYEFTIFLNENLYLFTSFRNRKLKQNFLFVQTINKNTLQLNRDVKKIAEIDYSGYSKWNAGSFMYDISRDSSHFMIYYDLPYDKGENERFGIHVFDDNLQELWQNEVSLPYEEELFDIDHYLVDNAGNAHLLATIYKEKRKAKRRGEPNYIYQIFSYFENGEKLEEYPVKIEGKFLSDMQIAIDDDQDIICSGFYSNVGTYSIKGTYFLEIDDISKEIKVASFKDFDFDFLTENMTDKQERKAKKRVEKGKEVELFEYDLDDIIIRKDGGAVLTGEQFYVRIVQSTTYVNGQSRTITTYYYYYNDIIVVNIDPEGNIEWARKIPKRQTTINDEGFFSSYATLVSRDKLYFIYNDHPNNLFIRDDGDITRCRMNKDAVVVLAEVDQDGNLNKQALFDVRDAEVITRPKVCKQVSRNEIIIFGQRKKVQRFAKVTIES